MKRVHYPEIRKELIRLVNEEQEELMNVFRGSAEEKNQKLHAAMTNCQNRAERLIEIFDIIKEPTIENVGTDGSEAISTLTMHSYLALMKKVARVYQRVFDKDKNNIYFKSIPSLIDRIMILETKKQLYGTQWMLDSDGKPFLIEIEDFETVNSRRKKYGLKPIEKPRDLTKGQIKHPLGQGKADKSHMKKLTGEEYELYSKYYLHKII